MDDMPLAAELQLVEAKFGPAFDELHVGMTASFTKIITDADLVMFAGISGDTNPVHFDQGYAAGTIFGRRIVHGMLVSSLISTVLGTKLPGPGCIYLSQTLKFIKPVYVGDTVMARATVGEIKLEKRHLIMKTGCSVDGREVVEGEARIWVPKDEKA